MSISKMFGMNGLVALFGGGEARLTKELAPTHVLRDDGIYLARMTAEVRQEVRNPSIQFVAAHGSAIRSDARPTRLALDDADAPVLPVPFDEPDLLVFLEIRPDLAWDIEARYTNDREPGASKTAAYPLDVYAFEELELEAPRVAEMLRCLLARGANWWKPVGAAVEPEPGATAAPESARQPRKKWRDVAWPYMVERLQSGSFATAVELNHALHSEAGSAGSPFEKGAGPHRGTLWLREMGQPLALKTIQNNWQKLLLAASAKRAS